MFTSILVMGHLRAGDSHMTGDPTKPARADLKVGPYVYFFPLPLTPYLQGREDKNVIATLFMSLRGAKRRSNLYILQQSYRLLRPPQAGSQ